MINLDPVSINEIIHILFLISFLIMPQLILTLFTLYVTPLSEINQSYLHRTT